MVGEARAAVGKKGVAAIAKRKPEGRRAAKSRERSCPDGRDGPYTHDPTVLGIWDGISLNLPAHYAIHLFSFVFLFFFFKFFQCALL